MPGTKTLQCTLRFSMEIIDTWKISVYRAPCNEETIESDLLKDSSLALYNEVIALNLHHLKARSLYWKHRFDVPL